MTSRCDVPRSGRENLHHFLPVLLRDMLPLFIIMTLWLNMINHCSVENALPSREDTHQEQFSNYIHEIFHEPLRSSWNKFLNRDITCMKSVFVYYKHFDYISILTKRIKEFVLTCISILFKSQEIASKTQVPRKLPNISFSWWGRLDELQKSFCAKNAIIKDFLSVIQWTNLYWNALMKFFHCK